jgi:hypothetical protein
MNITARVGGRPNANETRCLAYWVGALEMKAELKAKDSADPYFLAAILAAMQGNDPTYELPHGWHSLRFGIYKVKNEVPEGMVTVHPANISGLYRSYCIWLPIIRRNY